MISPGRNPLTMLLVAALGLWSQLGCTNEPKKVVVEGKITYGGGDWPKPAMATFACEKPAPGFDNQPGEAEIKTDGSFRTALYPGTYVVNLECWEVEPSMEDPSKQKSYIPQGHTSGMQSNFRVEVPVDAKGSVKVTRDIPKP